MSANISLINMMTSFAYILNSEYPSRPTWCILVVLNLVKSLRDVNKMSVCISLVVAGCWGVWFPWFTLYFWLLNVYITLSTFYIILCLSSMIARGHYGVFAWCCVFIPTTAALLMCLSRCFGNRCECFHELYYWRSLPLVHRSPLSRLLSFSKLYTFLISFTLYISSFISFSPFDVYPTTICIVACSMVTICHHIVL